MKSNMRTGPRMPTFCGQKIAASLANICAHYEYLVRKGFMDEKHMTFLVHCLYRLPETMDFSNAYFLKYEPLWSSEPGFYGPYSLPSHITFAVPQGMSTQSHSSDTSVRVDESIAAVSSSNVSVKVEETSAYIPASSKGVDPSITSTSEVTHNGSETAVATTPAHDSGIEAVTLTSQSIIPGTDSSIATIHHADIKGIDAPVASAVARAEVERVEAPITTVADAETKGTELSVTPSPVAVESKDIEAPVRPIAPNDEPKNIKAPVTPITSVSNIKVNQEADSTSDDEEDDFDFLTMPYDREANRSIYDDPPRSVSPKNSTPTAANSVHYDSPEKFSSFLQRCGQLGIKLASSSAEDSVTAEQSATQLPKPALTETIAVVGTPKFDVSEEITFAEAPKSNVAEEVVAAEEPKGQIPIFNISEGIQSKLTMPKPAQRGYGGVAVRYVTEDGTFARDGSVEFQTIALSKGVKPERMVTRHNSGVIVEALHSARGGLTGGGPRGDMKSLRFKNGDRLKIKKMLGNGWYLARKFEGDDQYSTVRIFKMEVEVKIASKTKLSGDTSASASRIVVRAPSPDQDFTWVPPHLRGANPTAPKVEVQVEPIVRKRYQEVLYFDGRAPFLVSETVTAVIN